MSANSTTRPTFVEVTAYAFTPLARKPRAPPSLPPHPCWFKTSGTLKPHKVEASARVTLENCCVLIWSVRLADMLSSKTLLLLLAFSVMAILAIATVVVLRKPKSRLKEQNDITKLTLHDLRWAFVIVVPLL